MSKRYLLLFSFLMLRLFSAAQDYSYTRYDITEGLAGSTVFCMLQDRQGFLWFGTETGVSRFDGTHFKNFSTYDGLPDNQVLEMFEDSKGRIWMAPFNKSVCYYYNGRIYNQQNDPALRIIKPSAYVANFAEDKDGNILLMQNGRMHLLRPNGTARVYMFETESAARLACIGVNYAGNFFVINEDRLYEIIDEKLHYVKQIDLAFNNVRYIRTKKGSIWWRSGTSDFHLTTPRFDLRVPFPLDVWVSKLSIISDSLVSVNMQIGAYIYDLVTKKKEIYLPGESVSEVYQDREGNLWFCTLNHGVFMLNSKHISNMVVRSRTGAKMGAYSVAKYRTGWLVGADMTYVILFTKDTAAKDYKRKVIWMFRDSIAERITSILPDIDSTYWIGSDSRLVRMSPNLSRNRKLTTLWGIKALVRSPHRVVAATGRNVLTIDPVAFTIKDTLWHERSTTVFEKNDTVYVGTLDGLYMVLKDSIPMEAGPGLPQLRNRIMDIRQSKDGALWIATYSGVFCFDNGRIVSSVTEDHGLVSNICKTLDIFENELWVGTNKGLQKVNITNTRKPVIEYLLSNELSSDIINAVKADSSTVVAATPEGVSIIDKKMVSFNSRCDLFMDKIMVSGQSLAWKGSDIFLPNWQNNIRFEFAGISYRSGGDVFYRYRLQGLDTNWRQTHDNYLNYPTLPGGDYNLQLQAINKFGVKSNMLSIPFAIEKKGWQKTWFQVTLLIFVALVVWVLLSWRTSVVRKQEAEKNSIRKKVSELEQLALKAQMNPHFIFNSLNSIQHYVLDKDIEGANRFITGFSRLIRQTLDMSSRHEISLVEEMNYLSTYLALEKIRLENKFTYEVTVEPGLKPEDSFIPPMILQPFVENCIRHGIRLRQDDQGRVTIHFKKVASYLECMVEDNGVGRKVAAQHKGKNPIEYQSKGISLTTDRINLLNRNNSRPIFLKIYDLSGSEGMGTRVVVSFPA